MFGGECAQPVNQSRHDHAILLLLLHEAEDSIGIIPNPDAFGQVVLDRFVKLLGGVCVPLQRIPPCQIEPALAIMTSISKYFYCCIQNPVLASEACVNKTSAIHTGHSGS